MVKTPNLLSYFKKENPFETTVSILKEKVYIILHDQVIFFLREYSKLRFICTLLLLNANLQEKVKKCLRKDPEVKVVQQIRRDRELVDLSF
jgi:hypothetical protein